MIVTGIIVAIVVTVAAIIWIVIKKKDKTIYETKTIEGPLTMDAVVFWFKSQNLDPKRYIPFVAKSDLIIASQNKNPKDATIKETPNERTPNEETADNNTPNKVQTILGVLDEKSDAIIHILKIESDRQDDSLKKVIGSEDIVILT